MKKILKDKEGKIYELKEQLRQVREDEIRGYRDSDAFIKELGGSFANDFDDCLCQIKTSFSLSHISIDAQAQTLACLADSK